MSPIDVLIEVERLEEGGYLLVCEAIPGCHAEGQTVGEALDNLRSVAEAIYELSVEQDLEFMPEHADATPSRIRWLIPQAEPT
ncbi:MAG: type II toxin-antitoxin system HicB family antitoxin [Chloroflexi bacterium]|nr:type II toxin-antitoxin system HicB family antitoxin [Chloroflexota bacterium]MBI3763920.1 type II toxin-antitoxin system HicB family antitoxin [Chloroflexota bacterium]